MHSQTHRDLGILLIKRLLPGLPKRYRSAFLLGCVEPDKNPITYLRGSVRHRWLSGHTFRAAHRRMFRWTGSLEAKSRWRITDWYTLGKLVHYTADSFTYAHSDSFPGQLAAHRAYERRRHSHFAGIVSLTSSSTSRPIPFLTQLHWDYIHKAPCVQTDRDYILTACTALLSALRAPQRAAPALAYL